MSILRSQFRDLVVVPVLDRLGLPSKDKAEQMLMAIAAYESLGGRYMKQMTGPALGVFQMEPGTFDLVWDRLWADSVAGKPQLHDRVAEFRLNDRVGIELQEAAEEMAWNHRLACAMARCLLWYNPARLPELGDRAGIYAMYLTTWRPGRKPTRAKFDKADEEWR